MKVITHNGIFHADEVTAVALIELAKCLSGEAEVIRTRDASLWEAVKAMPGSSDLPVGVDYVLDVGGINNRQWRLDHHQIKEGDAEYGISTAGLVWRYVVNNYYSRYGVDFYGEYDGTGESADEANPVLAGLIKEIDANDTGVKRSEDLYHEVIRNLNGVDPNNGPEQDKLFRIAVDFAKEVIKYIRGKAPKCYLKLPMTVERAAQMALTQGETNCYACGSYESPAYRAIKQNKVAKVRQAEAYRIAIAKAERSGYAIEFPKGEVYVPVSELIGIAHIAIQWDAGQDCWSIQTIPLERGSFKTRFKLVPIGDEVFCHPAGFISKTKSGRFNPVEQ